VTLHNPSGVPDVIVDDPRADREFQNHASSVERPSSLAGYERTGVPIDIEDD
jgi:hypothetical protein